MSTISLPFTNLYFQVDLVFLCCFPCLFLIFSLVYVIAFYFWEKICWHPIQMTGIQDTSDFKRKQCHHSKVLEIWWILWFSSTDLRNWHSVLVLRHREWNLFCRHLQIVKVRQLFSMPLRICYNPQCHHLWLLKSWLALNMSCCSD